MYCVLCVVGKKRTCEEVCSAATEAFATSVFACRVIFGIERTRLTPPEQICLLASSEACRWLLSKLYTLNEEYYLRLV